MSKGSLSDNHPNVARCPRIAAIDSGIEQAGLKYNAKARNRR